MLSLISILRIGKFDSIDEFLQRQRLRIKIRRIHSSDGTSVAYQYHLLIIIWHHILFQMYLLWTRTQPNLHVVHASTLCTVQSTDDSKQIHNYVPQNTMLVRLFITIICIYENCNVSSLRVHAQIEWLQVLHKLIQGALPVATEVRKHAHCAVIKHR